jgi:membrane protein
MKITWQLVRDIVVAWNEDKAPRLAGALAFYTMFTLAPLLILAIGLAGLAFGQEAARGQVVGQIQGLVGAESARAIEDFLEQVGTPQSGSIVTIVGLVTLLLGVWWVFGELQDALNTIWEVAPKPGRSIWKVARIRLVSFAMMLGVGFLLLVSLVISAALASLQSAAAQAASVPMLVWSLAHGAVSFGVITVLFALIFKVLPDVKNKWSDVWLGAAITAGLFTLGRFVIGQYIGRAALWSTYGTGAKSLVALLVWVYYSAQILFFGAEFTKAYAKRIGSGKAPPTEVAVPLTEEARAEQGIPKEEVVEAVAQVVERKREEGKIE